MVQPKILLKKEIESNAGSGSSGSNTEIPASIKTIIINRSDVRNSADHGPCTSVSTSSVCAALTGMAAGKERSVNGTPGTASPSSSSGTAAVSAATGASAGQDTMQPPRMVRPTPFLMANGVFNGNARKLFHKSNTDFKVIGVFGAQSVGKSTLLNLLTAERDQDYDYYQHLFSADADECIFPIRHRQQSSKHVIRPRTESMQFFITRERFVLLDSSPILMGGSAKEADHLDLQTLSTMMQLLSVCHVLLLALDELSLEHVRLLYAALRLRPRIPCKSYVQDFLPQLMFVRQRAKRAHFEPTCRDQLEKQLALLFEGTGLPIYRGRGEARTLNTFLLPEVHSNEATTYHASLPELVRQFRERVLGSHSSSPSSSSTIMCQGNDFNELAWFELFTEITRKCSSGSQHFEKIYAEIKLRHVELRSKWRPDTNWRNEGSSMH